MRGGPRWSTPGFLLEAKARARAKAAFPGQAAGIDPPGPRFGFTVTKKLGGAVVRNRIRRRLKEAARHLAAAHALADCDYVLVAREEALKRPFGALLQDLLVALERVNRRLPRP